MEVESESVKANTECAICGFVPGPHEGCGICHGNRNYIQVRQYTRSEEIRGQNTDEARYSRTGDVGVKVALVPGSKMPGQ